MQKLRRCSTFSRREGLFPPYPEPTKAEIKLFTTCAREGPASPEQVQEAAGDVRIVATRLCEASVHGLELKLCTSTTRPPSQEKIYYNQLSFGADDRINKSALRLFLSSTTATRERIALCVQLEKYNFKTWEFVEAAALCNEIGLVGRALPAVTASQAKEETKG